MYWEGYRIGMDVASAPKIIVRAATAIANKGAANLIIHTSSGEVLQMPLTTDGATNIYETIRRIIYWRETI